MVLDGRGPDRGWQEDGSEGGSSSRSNDVPANLPNYYNDPSLTGSSSHGPRPQGSGPTTFYPLLVPYSQNGYPLTPQSGPTLSNEPPRGFQTDLTQTWPNGQVTDTLGAVDTTRYYSSAQYTPGDAPLGNTRHSIDRSSPFYPMEPPNNTMVQPARHQQPTIPYPRDRRPSFPQLHAPVPHQPTDYASLSSPPRPNSSYSHPGLSPQRPGPQMPLPMVSQWPPPYGQSSRSTSNSTPSTYPHSSTDSQSPAYHLDVVPSGNSSQASYFTPLAQLPSYPLETSSYPPYPPNNDPGGGPSFPVPQLATPPAPAKGKGVTRNHPYPQSDRQTRRKVSRPNEPSVASGSDVKLDTPQKAQTPAQEKDAKRKRVERADLGDWFKRIASLLSSSGLDPKPTHLQLLTRVIKHLGGTPPDQVDHPEKANTKKGRSLKSTANAVRAHNENRAYDRIWELLQAGGRFNSSSTPSHLNLLRIVVYVLSNMGGDVVDEELAELIRKFLNPPG